MAEIIDLGKLRFSYQGAWSDATSYSKNDVVLYQGSSYVYKFATATSANLPTNTTYWSKLAEGVYVEGGSSGKVLTNNGSTISWTDDPELTTVVTTADATVGDQLFVGASASTLASSLTNPKVVIQTAPADGFAQLAFRNTGNGTASSTDVIAYANNGTNSAGYIDMGITAASFNDPDFTITEGHDGYIFMEAPTGTSGAGNLVLATGANGTQNKIVFAAGGLQSDNTQMVITPDQNIHIEIPTPSLSPTTGALTVVGGVGIQGDVNIQGAISFGGSGTSVETANLNVVDPHVYTNKDNLVDSTDGAFLTEYAATITTVTAAVSNKSLTSNVATLTTLSAHSFVVGDVVVVTSVDSTFNGTYVIRATPTSTTFTYEKINANVASASVSSGQAAVSRRRRIAGLMRDATDGVWKLVDVPTTDISNGVVTPSSYGTLNVGSLGFASGGFLNTTGNYAKVDALWERVELLSGNTTGTLTVAVTTAKPIQYLTSNQTANRTINFTGGSSMAVGESVTFCVMLTCGATPYYPNVIQIDASAVTPRWQLGVAPTAGNASSVDVYTFHIIKTAATPTYTVFATQTKW